MALSHELPIYKDTYKLILLIFKNTKEFAREYKYALGQDMKRDSIQLVRSINQANRLRERYLLPISETGWFIIPPMLAKLCQSFPRKGQRV